MIKKTSSVYVLQNADLENKTIIVKGDLYLKGHVYMENCLIEHFGTSGITIISGNNRVHGGTFTIPPLKCFCWWCKFKKRMSVYLKKYGRGRNQC